MNYTSGIGANTLEYRLDARYQSRYNSFGESNDAIYYRPGTTLINGSITWGWGDRGSSISLFGRNLSQQNALRMVIGASVFPVAVYEPPRLLGVELRLNI